MAGYTPEKGERFSVRFSTAGDCDRLISFFTENQHAATALRQEEQYRDRISNGAGIIVANQQEDIVAASMSYPLYDFNKMAGRGVPSHEWTEFGSTRAVLNGYKLYQLMVASTTLQQFAMEPPKDRFVAEVYTDNTGVNQMLGGDLAWATIASPPDALKMASSGTLAQTVTKPVYWYQCATEHMPHQARVVLDYIDNPVIQRTKQRPGEDGQPRTEVVGEIQLDFSRFSLATMLRDYMDTLARQDFGDMANPDPSKKLRDYRAHLANSNAFVQRKSGVLQVG